MMFLHKLTPSHTYNKFLHELISSGKLETKNYIFGSAVWKIPMGLFTPNDDIDWLFHLSEFEKVNDLIDKYRPLTESITMTKINNNHDLYSILRSSYSDPISHYEIKILDNEQIYKIDMIFVENTEKFIKSMSDFDCGMLLFDCITNVFFVGGNNGIILRNDKLFDKYNQLYIDTISIKDILKSIKNKTIEFNFYNSKNLRTTFYRLHKLLQQGFTIDYEKYSSEIITLFNKSFCLKPEKYNSKHQILFYENCINPQSYEIIKNAYNNIKNPKNEITDQYIAYALTLGDYDESIKAINNYYLATSDFMKLMHIPDILFEKYSFNETITFYNKLVEKIQNIYHLHKSINDINIEIINEYSNYSISQFFSSCVLKNIDCGFELYNKLITINPDFEIVPRNKFIHVIINHHKFDDINKFLINSDELEIFFTNYCKYNNLSQFLIMNPSYIDHISHDIFITYIVDNDLFDGHNALCLNKRAHYQDLLKRFDKNTNFQNIKKFYSKYSYIPRIGEFNMRHIQKIKNILILMNKYDMLTFIIIQESIEKNDFSETKNEINKILDKIIDYKSDIIELFKYVDDRKRIITLFD